MTTFDLVKQVCKEKNISLSELARRLGQTRQMGLMISTGSR